MNNIKNLREAVHLSQTQIAEKLGVTQQAVAKWENGGSFPRINKAMELSAVLGCSVNELYASESAKT